MIKNYEDVNEKQFIDELKKENGIAFSIRSRNTRKIYKDVVNNASKECLNDKSVRFYKDKDTEEVNTITFPIKKHGVYFKYRKMDMENDYEPVHGEGTNTPTMKELNFSKSVIGSDETGASEIFKPIVVAAAYVENEKQVEKWINMGISDSKDFPNRNKKGEVGVQPNTKLMKIGERVTGLSTWNDVLKYMNEDKLIVSDFFAIRIITNEEYNKTCEDVALKENRPIVTRTGIKEKLLKNAHAEVLSVLKEKSKDAVVVIDDFTDEVNQIKKEGQSEEEKDFRVILDKAMPNTDIYLTTKGDAKIMAIALGSVISSYVSQLGIMAAEREFQDKLGIDEIPHGAFAEKNDKFINNLQALSKEKLNNLKPLMEMYAKIYYESAKERIIDRIDKVIDDKK